ncbi:MAG: phosphopantothenoylcysteine decarboxylase [Cyanobium sp.]
MSDFHWNFAAPRSAAIGDHEVPLRSRHLENRRIALLVTGGIASYRAPGIARCLRRRGAEVTAFCTPEALRYVGSQALEWATLRPLITELSWRAEHLSDSEPFDAWLVAPATFNTIGKLAHGIADTAVTVALASALGRLQQGRTAVLVAPTMHGSMHTPILERNCRSLAALGVQFIPPRDAYGKHNLPDEELLCAAVCRALSGSPLRGVRVLVTGGPTPVPIDGVRRIVNRFRGRLAACISEELVLRGAELNLILGEGSAPPPPWLPHAVTSTYDDYRRLVLEQVEAGQRVGIFSAGVADYRPTTVVQGKIASGSPALSLDLEPTEKVIDAVAAADPQLFMVTFKYLEGLSEPELIREARRRLERFPLVVVNRGEDTQGAEQTAWLASRRGELRISGKDAIAAAVCDQIEAELSATP